MKLQFSGHESFICKHFWLKKGYDFVIGKGNFNAESAVIELGVGKNMVTSISYWLKSFGIVDHQSQVTQLGDFLFHDKQGVDPYIESLATIWLLHYSLLKTSKASIYTLFFNEFRKGRVDFTKEQFLNFIKRRMEDDEQSFNEKTVGSDLSVFIRNYLNPTYKDTKIDIEEDFSGLLIDLDLIRSFKSENAEGRIVDWFQIENKLQIDLPSEIVLFAILDNEMYGKSIPFKELLVGDNSPGVVFALSEEGLFNKIETIVKDYKGIVYTETAGIRELQIKRTLNKWEILHGYFKN
ncbi:DUF4007 family protein [Pseudoflavitalea sp. X16]|uniref:DUF4007 family protein n=1 Tax=Paraflavitalea devenefica TaxID=2716334 RepID=UPI00141EDBAE|nr:DUF4007 family protein [Paraflavitalea devenefica]NII24362.1 DUF4007 family protein [Paraflavitalea devenefica]